MHVIVMGAGPAGLSCAYDLHKQGARVTVFDKDRQVGGLAKTIQRGPLRMDLGPHRFFATDPVVNRIWEEILGDDLRIVSRLTRIHYNGRFFFYPLKPLNALRQLGIGTSAAAIVSYLRRRLAPFRPEDTFATWVANRFGDRLFRIFFQSYTEKVWGIPCAEIAAEWASQRIQGLNLVKAVLNALGSRRSFKTLADEFTYPRLGSGQTYEKIRTLLESGGQTVALQQEVTAIHHDRRRVQSITVRSPDGTETTHTADAFVASIPLTLLVERLDPPAPPEVLAAARQLKFRNTILVYVTVEKPDLFPDNWLYLHSPDIRAGRVTNFRNWSPDLYGDSQQTVLCLEYWCFDEDAIWQEAESALTERARHELARTGLCDPAWISDAWAVRLPRSYPVYRIGYREHLDVLVRYLKSFDNLQEVGRYGTFKYNNQDHAILMGYLAARNLAGERHDLWDVNTDTAYYESGAAYSAKPSPAGGGG